MTPNNQDATPLNPAEQSLAEAERLIWALLDDNLEAAEATRLSALMEEDAAVRARYVECVQLHVDLSMHFSERLDTRSEPAARTPVLPNLLPGGLPGIECFPPVAD